jgi:hypothetical protein
MASLLLPSRFTQQPPLGTPIDPKWIERGLQMAWGPNTYFYVAEPWRASAQTFIGTNIGAVANEGGFSTYLNGNNQVNIAGTFVGASPTEFTLIVACKTVSVASDSILLSVSNGANIVMLQQRVSATAGYMLFSRSSAGDVQISPGITPTVGPLRTVGGVWRSGTGEKAVFNNGVKTATSTTDTGTLAVTKIAIAGDARSSGQCFNGTIPIALIFNKALTDAEMRSLTENPWQIFKPVARRLWAVASAAPGVTGSLLSTLDGVTLSASGQAIDNGSIASTLGGASFSASGTVGNSPSGSVSSTLAGASMAASGSVIAAGSLASTLGGASMSTSGTVTNRGMFASALDGASLTASGSALANPTGSLSSALDDTVFAAGGYVGTPPAGPDFFIRLPKNPRHVIHH